MDRPAGLREEHLCLAWERQMVQPGRLLAGGDHVQVVFPGRRCGDPGPDFRDAVLALPDARLWRGDVEVHLERAGWEAHGHGANPAYDRVILHVTWAEAEPVVNSAGVAVPALALATCLAVAPETLAAMPVRQLPPPGTSCPCAVSDAQAPALPAFLQEQGMARLAARAALMAADAAVVGYDQAFWSALLRGLGYQRNVTPFLQLARVVPWSVATANAGRPTRREDVTALLLGAAGLLESPPRVLPPADELARQAYRERWRAVRAHCADRPLGRSEWTLAAVRPDNMPARRIAAGAGLVLAYAAGLGDALRAIVAEGDRPCSLSVGDDPFWSTRADFGRVVGPDPVSLLGAARERELLVNAVLPGVLAMARDRGDGPLEQAVYRRYARLGAAGSNQISRHMLRTIGAPASVMKTAAAEQGLLHLYHQWCRERRCWECPLPGAFDALTRLPGGSGDTSVKEALA
jgi:hypothetical protein